MKASHALGAIIVVAAIAGLYWYASNPNGLPLGNVGGSAPAGNTNPTAPPSTPNTYQGSVTFSTVGTQTTNGTAITLDTNADIVFFFKNPGGTYQRAGAESDGGEAIVVSGNDIVYAEVTIPTSQNFFVDWRGTVNSQADKTVGTPSYIDPTFDGVPTYVFPLDISKVKAQGNPNFAPTYTWYPKFVADQTFAANAATSLTGVGTGTKTSTIQSSISIDTNGGGEAFKAIQIRVNGTQSTNEVAEEQTYITFPDASKSGGTDTIYVSQMTASYDYSGAVSIFRKDYSYTVDGANIVTIPQTGSKQINIPITVTTNMDGANDGVCLEYRLETISARNIAGTAITDDIEIAAPSSNGNECSIT